MSRARSGAADRIDDLAALFEQYPILGGRLVTFTAGEGGTVCKVAHALGRSYRGALPVAFGAVGVTDVYPLSPDVAARAGVDTTRFLALNSPANAVITYLVF